MNQKLYLTGHTPLLEQFDSLFDRTLDAMNGHVGINNFLHSVADTCYISLEHLATDIQLAGIATTDRSSYNQLPLREEVLNGLGQNKEQCPGVGAHTARGMQALELHVLVVIETVVHALGLVVDAGTDWAVRQIERGSLKHIEQRASKRDAYRLSRVFTANVNQPLLLPVTFFKFYTVAFHVLC